VSSNGGHKSFEEFFKAVYDEWHAKGKKPFQAGVVDYTVMATEEYEKLKSLAMLGANWGA
jgi:hypothetical protein